jgi:hypothetical protein
VGGTLDRDPAGKLVSMKWISTPTLSLEKIRNKGNKAVAELTGAPG